jgi:hypothetical protein
VPVEVFTELLDEHALLLLQRAQGGPLLEDAWHHRAFPRVVVCHEWDSSHSALIVIALVEQHSGCNC